MRADAAFTAVATPGNGISAETASRTVSRFVMVSAAYSAVVNAPSSLAPWILTGSGLAPLAGGGFSDWRSGEEGLCFVRQGKQWSAMMTWTDRLLTVRLMKSISISVPLEAMSNVLTWNRCKTCQEH